MHTIRAAWTLRRRLHIAFDNDLRRNTFRRAYVHRWFAEPEKHLLRKSCSLPVTIALNEGLSAASLLSNRSTFDSGVNLILDYDAIKAEGSSHSSFELVVTVHC